MDEGTVYQYISLLEMRDIQVYVIADVTKSCPGHVMKGAGSSHDLKVDANSESKSDFILGPIYLTTWKKFSLMSLLSSGFHAAQPRRRLA